MQGNAFSHDALARWFFLILGGVLGYLFFQIISPFLITLLAAAMVAILVTPAEKWLRAHVHHPRASTLIVLIAIAMLVVGPLAGAAVLAVQQAVDIAQWMVANPGWMEEFSVRFAMHTAFLPPFVQDALAVIDVSALMQSVVTWVKVHGAEVFSSGASLIFKLFIFFVSLYFFLFDRERIMREMVALSPLKDAIDKNILMRIVQTIRGVVFGSLIVACVQGIIAAIGLTVFGVPGALLWAALVVIAAQIPMLGTATVMLPAVVYLFVVGDTISAFGLMAWALVAVGLVDNVLQPLIVGERTRMHALLILLSMLGGLQFFGPLGFILGPTILAAFLVILEMYKGGFLQRLS